MEYRLRCNRIVKRLAKVICLYSLLLIPYSSTQAQLIYEISGNSSANKSYILATNKFINFRFVDTIPNIFQYFSNCDKVITEFTMQDYEALQALREAAVLPDSVRLSDQFTTMEYQQINQALLQTLQMDISQLCRMKPSYLCEMLRNEYLQKSLGYDSEQSIESFFQLIASEKGLPIYKLDNVGETLYMLFDREPFHHQCKDLLKVVTNPKNEIELERTIRDLYREGLLTDIMYGVTTPDNTSSVSYSDYQVYAQRNLTWTKRLAPYLKEGKAFIILNAIYLGGEQGLLHQLRQAGYKVKPANKARTAKPQE